MRDLKRNCRPLYYSEVLGTVPLYDEYGNETLEVSTEYGSPTLLSVNVSANVGQEAVEVFGTATEYSRTVCFANECPLKEGYKVWFGVSPTEPNNYIVAKVADSKNGYLVALREVSPK